MVLLTLWGASFALKLVGKINDYPFTVLLDSGCNLSFIDSSVGRDNVRDLIRPSIYHWLGDWIGIRGELIGCHGTNGALRWLPTASLAEISLFVESGKESYLNRKVGLVHSHLSLIIDDLASCSSKHPAYQFIILGARSFLSTLFFLCYSRNDVPKEIKVTRSQLWFFFPYRTFPKEISSWGGSAPTTHQICLLFCSALYIFSSYEKEWILMKFFIQKINEWRIFWPLIW